MKKDRTNLIFLISILVTLLVVASFILFFKVIKNKNKHTSRTLSLLEEKIQNKQNSDNLLKRSSELKATSDHVNSYFINPDKIDTFVSYLEKMGTDNNAVLSVKNVEVSTRAKDTLIVKISATGSFSNVMKVVYLLENSPYVVSLNQAFVNKQIKQAQTDKNGKVISAGSSYWQADVSFNILSLPQ